MSEVDEIGAICVLVQVPAQARRHLFANRRRGYPLSSDLPVTIFFVRGIQRAIGSNVGTLVGSLYSSDLSYYVVEVNKHVEKPV